MKDEYTLMEPQPAEPVAACPCCGSSARVWVYSEDEHHSATRVVMCDQQGDIGPRDSLMYEGCLLKMPPNDFYRETGRDAVRYWNAHAQALTALQRANRWKTAQVLRDPQIETDCSKLTPREVEVLQLSCKGLTCREIGALLKIKESTTVHYRRVIFQKLDVGSVAESAVIAAKAGLA